MGCAFLLNTHCAVYDDSWPTSAPEDDVASAGHLSADNGSLVSHPAVVIEQGDTGGSTHAAGGDVNVPSDGGSASTNGGSTNGGSTSTDGGSTSTNGGSASAGSTNGGSGSSAGSGGSASGGSTSGGGAVPSESWNYNNLSRGKPARADSEQTTWQHYASDANDGDRRSRWCAADYRLNHYWEVDLGETFSLSTLRILWEKDASYLFKVESSVDHASWSLLLDKTEFNSATANQQHSFAPGAKGRYVRLTVTGGVSPTMWASFYELDIFGH